MTPLGRAIEEEAARVTAALEGCGQPVPADRVRLGARRLVAARRDAAATGEDGPFAWADELAERGAVVALLAATGLALFFAGLCAGLYIEAFR